MTGVGHGLEAKHQNRNFPISTLNNFDWSAFVVEPVPNTGKCASTYSTLCMCTVRM